MKNLVLTVVSFFAFNVISNAQNASAAANQQVSLNLSNAISIIFTGTGTSTGATVNMAFNTVSDYLNGVTSAAQQLKVQSNTNFNVVVKYDLNSFTYTGNGVPNFNNIPLDAFRAKVTENATGGNIAAPFSATNFAPLLGNDQNIINNGHYGADQTFSVMYKCTPGLGLVAGTYSINIVYTATQQ